MLKAEIIDYLLDCDVERRNCGAPYSNSWCQRRQQYMKERKVDLEMLACYYAESDCCHSSGLY